MRELKRSACVVIQSTHQSVVTAMDVLGKLGFTRINIATIDEAKTSK